MNRFDKHLIFKILIVYVLTHTGLPINDLCESGWNRAAYSEVTEEVMLASVK